MIKKEREGRGKGKGGEGRGKGHRDGKESLGVQGEKGKG